MQSLELLKQMDAQWMASSLRQVVTWEVARFVSWISGRALRHLLTHTPEMRAVLLPIAKPVLSHSIMLPCAESLGCDGDGLSAHPF
jgi:hypothetical protein